MAEEQHVEHAHSFSSALQIYSEKQWESLLEKLDNPEDILNVLTAFPELHHLSSGKQCIWFIGAVMPLLFPKVLNVRDMKSSRRVSRFWKIAVDTTIETHPDKLPYNSSRLNRMTENHFNYHRLPNLQTTFRESLKWRLDALVKRNGIQGNPFPGRSVYIPVSSDVYRQMTNHRERAGGYLNGSTVYTGYNCLPFPEAVPILQRYGNHIWYLTINVFPICCSRSSPETVTDIVVDLLSKCFIKLTNLKSLKIISKDFPFGSAKKSARKKLFSPATFPFKLESIDIWQFSDKAPLNPYHHSFMMALINHDQVKKLSIRASDWKRKYAGMLPNLNELCLYFADKEKLEMILNDMQNAPVQKLQIYTSGMLMTDLLEIWSHHQLESVSYFGKIVEAEQNEDENTKDMSARKVRKARRSARVKNQSKKEKTASTPSLTSFRFILAELPKIGFRFLNSFPSLQYLTINVTDTEQTRPTKQDSETWKSYEESNDLLLQSLYKASYKDEHCCHGLEYIWKVLPNLRLLTVVGCTGTYQYVRETRNVYRSQCNS